MPRNTRQIQQKPQNMQDTLPTRLLDVGTQQGSHVLRLRKTQDLGTNIAYVTLSHCWGKIDSFKLKCDSLAAMYESICLEELPKTFQDAVIIARRLKYQYQYLWIDSLCIIQDSEDDWRRESAMMGDIYRNASCCIAALSGHDSQAGCFMQRNPIQYFPCKMGRSSDHDLVVHLNPEDGRFNHAEGWFDRKDLPLWTRAWVFQENVLSPRTLNCASNMLFWECHQLRAWESKPDGFSDK
jgi:hypothetical protein